MQVVAVVLLVDKVGSPCTVTQRTEQAMTVLRFTEGYLELMVVMETAQVMVALVVEEREALVK
jgi:hypothetical protein